MKNSIAKIKTPKEIVREIAMDIGKNIVAYIEVMYPEAIKITSSTFKLSIRNSIVNEIEAAVQVTDEGLIFKRIEDNKKFRRRWVKAYRDIRGCPKEPTDRR